MIEPPSEMNANLRSVGRKALRVIVALVVAKNADRVNLVVVGRAKEAVALKAPGDRHVLAVLLAVLWARGTQNTKMIHNGLERAHRFTAMRIMI